MAKSFNARMKDRFTKITNDYQKVNEYVHETAMMIAKHAQEHKDCSTAQGLVMAMPASTRREMLILWFTTYTPIIVKNSDDHTSRFNGAKLKQDNEGWDLDAGNSKPFYELAKENKEPELKDFAALVALVHGLGPRIKRMIENGEIEADDVASAEAMAERVKGLRFKRIEAENDDDRGETGKAAPVAA